MSTVLDLTAEERERYVVALRKRMAEHAKPLSDEQRLARQQLLAQIRVAAQMIKARFGAQRVILFGSLAHEAWFYPQSDVDLAVEGLSSRDYWEAWRLAEQVIPDRRVDMVELETARPALRNAIQRNGVEL